MKSILHITAKITSLTVGLCLLYACNEPTNKPTDTLGKGSIQISVDETFKPIIENTIAVFESNHPEAHIKANYKSESECYKDLMADSTHLILVTRPPSAREETTASSQKIVLDHVILARDAIAVITHPDNADTALGMQQLLGILTGKSPKKYTVVFDNQGSSTLRFIQDSLLQGAALASNVYASSSNPKVVEYVSANKDAIGFVGLSYVSDTGDSINEAFLDKVKLVALYNEKERQYQKPYQAYIALQQYPLTRSLYYVSREHYPGLATGFANFLSDQRGQLIFSKFRLFPLRMNVIIREAQVNVR